MEKVYNPQEFEKRIYEKWMEEKCFTPKVDPSKPAFSIVLPPPNITGQLHMGHALNNTIQDIIIRHKRMSGFETLWLPGTDHASIATEVKVVDKIMEETGLTKLEYGREKFMERAYAWKEQYGGRICEQMKRLGDSCDWSRLAFTMDERCSKAVKQAFVNLYNKGLIYKGNRIVHWCPSCKTALSDAEVEFEEQGGHLWHIRYPFKDGSGEIIVATTRPETMLGDTAVAVNSKDERYAGAVGKEIALPLTNRTIKIVADDYVETEFGTGAVKITPAHDPNDFEIGLRHNLENISVIGKDGKMNQNAGDFCGLDRFVARKKIVALLEEQGLLVKVENYKHNVGTCYRCHHNIESLISDQWYVKMKPLATPAIKAVEDGKIEFLPKRFEKIYFNWMNDIRDWCISRQLWWGHRIPCWYCEDCGEMIVAENAPTACPKCHSVKLKQDEDVLDTWFSSALWPFSTLGHPEETEDFKYFYPNNILVTAYDIITFWVSRMIFSGIEHTGQVPFPKVLIHGIVRDSQGRKMSKSLGNGVDPIEMIDKYGADALRFALVQGISNGSDVNFSEEKLEGARNFMNKIWNASRFIWMNLGETKLKDIKTISLSEVDKWILSRLNTITAGIQKDMDKYEFNLAEAKLLDFIWSDFCDWYIELTKPSLYGQDQEAKTNTLSVLVFVLKSILKLAHPFIPFITEEIWSVFDSETLMVQDYPKYDPDFEADSSNFIMVKNIIEKIRSIRAEMKVQNNVTFPVYIKTENEEYKQTIIRTKSYFEKLAGVSECLFVKDKAEITEKISQGATSEVEFYIPLGLLVDPEKERARLLKEIENKEAMIRRGQNLLNNAGFLAKAPPKLIEEEKSRLEMYIALKERLEDQLKDIEV